MMTEQKKIEILEEKNTPEICEIEERALLEFSKDVHYNVEGAVIVFEKQRGDIWCEGV